MEKNILKNLKQKKFHFIGIGGISMSALAQILKKNGYLVQGSDLVENDEVKILKKKGIMVFNSHSKNNIAGAEVVVYSSAIHDDNEELLYARMNNLIILKRAELLGLIADEFKSIIAVAGSHGKTTTTAMIAEIFIKANLKPTIHLGGRSNLINSNYKLGSKKFFITEACEYMDNYMYIKPDLSVILNIDSDHLDYFKTLDNIKISFEKFSKNIRNGGIIVINNDDVNTEKIRINEDNASFGIKNKSDIYARDIREYYPCKFSFNVYFCGVNLGKIKLNILGKHNIYNALASILVALSFEIDFSIIKEALESFTGVERRCEYIGKINEATVYHDYAHHPKKIEKMIKVAMELNK